MSWKLFFKNIIRQVSKGEKKVKCAECCLSTSKANAWICLFSKKCKSAKVSKKWKKINYMQINKGNEKNANKYEKIIQCKTWFEKILKRKKNVRKWNWMPLLEMFSTFIGQFANEWYVLEATSIILVRVNNRPNIVCQQNGDNLFNFCSNKLT